MTVSLPWDRLLQDMLDCMGWGLLLAIGYDLARTLVGTGFWRCLVLDLTGFLAAAVVVSAVSPEPHPTIMAATIAAASPVRIFFFIISYPPSISPDMTRDSQYSSTPCLKC